MAHCLRCVYTMYVTMNGSARTGTCKPPKILLVRLFACLFVCLSVCLFILSFRWCMSSTCLVDEHSALPDRTVCRFRRSNCQSSAVERFRSQQHSSGTGFLTMSRGQFVVGFSAAAETHFVPAVIPRHYPVTFLNCNTHSGPSSGIAIRRPL